MFGSSRRKTADPALFGDDVPERDVPGRAVERRHGLEAIGQTAQSGWQPGSAAGECKTAVIIAAAHPEAMPPAIEADQGHQNQIDACGRVQDAPDGFGDAEPVALERNSGPIGDEIHPEWRVVVQSGQRDCFPLPDGHWDQCAGVDFTIGGLVERNAARCSPHRQACQPFQDALAPLASLPRRQGTALLAYLSTQTGAGERILEQGRALVGVQCGGWDMAESK